MKKIFLTAVISVLCMSTAFAQSGLSFIVNGGVQATKLSNLNDSKFKLGYRIGAAVDIPILDTEYFTFSFLPGVNYASKGFYISKAKSGNNKPVVLNYVEAPLLLNFRIGFLDKFSINLNGGPYVAYGINGKYPSQESLMWLSSNKKENINPFKEYTIGNKKYSVINRLDYGLQVGAGIEISHIMIGLAAQYGVSNLFSKNDQESIKDNLKDPKKGERNMGLYATIGFKF